MRVGGAVHYSLFKIMTGVEKKNPPTKTNKNRSKSKQENPPLLEEVRGKRSAPTTFQGVFSPDSMVSYIIRDFTTDTRRKEAGWCWQAGLWWEVTLAQQRLCLKIPSRDLAVSINRWTPRAWRRGRGSGRKLYLTMITIWHLPELHILDKSSWLSRSPACANEVAGNRILLAPTTATPYGGPTESLFCLFHPPPVVYANRRQKCRSCRWAKEKVGPWRIPWLPSVQVVGLSRRHGCCVCRWDFEEVLLHFFGPNLPDL